MSAAARQEAWQSLPPALSRIREAIERSRDILGLSDGWDGEAGRRIEEASWCRAVDFLTRQAALMWERFGKILEPPDITPVPDGSIDIHWDRPDFELLVNIPSLETATAGFYGDDRGRISIKGELDIDKVNEGLALWLMKT